MGFFEHAKAIVAVGKNNIPTLKGFLHLSMLRGVQIIMGLVTTYFLTRSLSVSQFGEYQFVLNMLGILGIFGLTEFNNTLMQSIARGYTGSYKKLFPYPLLISFAGSLVLLVFAAWYGVQKDNAPLMICFLMAAITFPLMQGLTLWRGLKIGEKNFFGFAKIEMCALFCTQLGIIAMTQIYGGEYVGVFLIFIAVPSLINLFMLYRVRYLLHVSGPAEDGIVPHGLKSSFYASFFIASNYVDKILLFFFLSPASLAYFAAADRMAELLKTSAQDIANALAPKFAETNNYTKRLDHYLKLFCLVFGAFMVVFSFTLLPYAIDIIYGSSYHDSIFYAQILIFAAAIGNLSSMQFRYIRSKLDTDNFRDIVVYTSIFRMVSSIILIYTMGINGAILSVLAYRLVLTIYTNYLIKRDYQILPL